MLFQILGMQDTIFSPLLKEVIEKIISLLSPHLSTGICICILVTAKVCFWIWPKAGQSSAHAGGEISEGVVYGEQSQHPYQSPKQKQQESADTTFSKEAVIRQILNIFFLGKSFCEFKKQRNEQKPN